MSFATAFASADAVIMSALGDDIVLTPPVGAALPVKCVLASRPGKNNQDGYSWLDNIIAKVDVYSVIVEVLDNDVPGICKGWSALYFGKIYDVSEALPKGDGVLVVILNQPGNTTATANGWK
ncbi:hypothetical protein B0F88_103107 [Methylobacter tundripaludum]|uniref:Uncharacterized protein n=1 Tax=Methylobacter tundripaludum TaxID=173365 RepID=A0A2S6H5D6_9GAMM|nr:hypothetical protein [Methylobacter tundripaludum]PPK72674.1 hypothetical protein B0F88_103107 [Methylobacter tundripaludum]